MQTQVRFCLIVPLVCIWPLIANADNSDAATLVSECGTPDLPQSAVDSCLERVLDAVAKASGVAMVTADHGNAEEMAFPNGEPNTQHSTNPVPVVFIAKDAARFAIRDGGLVDVAPTLLGLLGLPVPDRMTGRTLLDRPAD